MSRRTPLPRHQIAPPRLIPDYSVDAQVARFGDGLKRALRADHERAVAVAIAQPQGLGLLFAGLRPRGQR